MRNRFPGLALILCLGLGTVIAIPTGAAEQADAKKVAKLIETLGSDNFADREKAAADLEALGAVAVDALRKAAKSKDIEVSKRAAGLLAKIETRAETARLLAPKKVHLVYQDTPVSEAVADFAKKSGYPIQVVDPDGKLKDRKMSLDTGEVTFWHAFDLFCKEASLKEMDRPQGFGGGIGGVIIGPAALPIRRVPPARVPPAKEAKPPQKEEKQGALNRVPADALAVAFAAPGAAPVPAVAPAPVGGFGIGAIGFGGGIGGTNQLVLVDGKTKPLPTDTRSAIRVRAMDDVKIFGTPDAQEILLGLQLTPEPKLQLVQILNVRVEKAQDDQDQRLVQAPAKAPAANAPVALPGGLIRGPLLVGGLGNMTPVHLKKGDKASKALKELSGTVTAVVLAPATVAITADKIMTAAGKEFKGAEGGKIKVIAVTKNANGQITVRFELEQPPNLFPANPFGAWNGGSSIRILPAPAPAPRGAVPAKPLPGAAFRYQPPPAAPVQIKVQIKPGVVIVGAGGAAVPFGGANVYPFQSNNGITLEDQKGKDIQVVGISMNFRRDARGFVPEHIMVFQPLKDQKATKLVFSGCKSVTIDIPFTLKNVTLP